MPDWTALAVPDNDRPHALLSPDGRRIELARDPGAIPPDTAREIVFDRFPAENERDAVAYFQNLVRLGKSAHPLYRIATTGKPWRPKGTPHYLNAQGHRLKIPQVVVDKSKDNRELWCLNGMMGSLAERYHAARHENFVAIVSPPDKVAVKGTLVEATKLSARLHACAAAAADMITEVYAAFGIDEPDKEFQVISIHDEQLNANPDKVAPEGGDQIADASEPPKTTARPTKAASGVK